MPHDRSVRVMVAEDDATTRQTLGALLRSRDLHVYEASCGVRAIEIARSFHLDLALLDLNLPDMTALDVVSMLRAERIAVPWILMSAFMDFDVALEAGRRGALRAVSASFDIEAVVLEALSRESRRESTGWPALPLSPRLMDPGSTISRASWLILKACDCVDDLPTLGRWAAFLGVSNTQLRDTYYRIDVAPHDARDLMRIFRVLTRTAGNRSGIEAELDVGDYRTEAALLVRAGVTQHHGVDPISPSDFMTRQSFLPRDHTLVREILNTLKRL